MHLLPALPKPNRKATMKRILTIAASVAVSAAVSLGIMSTQAIAGSNVEWHHYDGPKGSSDSDDGWWTCMNQGSKSVVINWARAESHGDQDDTSIAIASISVENC